MIDRVKTWRALRRNSSSNENSVRVSSIGRPERVTSRVPRSSSRSAKRRTSLPSSPFPARRSRARRRASSSARARGLREIVVGTGVEPGDSAVHLGPCGEHENRHPDALRAVDGRPRGRRFRALARPGRSRRRVARARVVRSPLLRPTPARSRTPRARARAEGTHGRRVRRPRRGSSSPHCARCPKTRMGVLASS